MAVYLFSQDDIQRVFDCALLDVLPDMGLASHDVAWPNVNFDPSPDRGYLRPFILPGTPQQATLGYPCFIRMSGIYQISIYRPKGEGLAAAREWKNILLSAFFTGRVLVDGDQQVIIDNAYSGSVQQEEDRMVIPISVSYYCYAPQQPD